MINRNNFKNFIDEVISPYAQHENDADLRVDPFANFDVRFVPCSNKDFANSKKIAKYGGDLGKMFLNKDLHKFIKNINDVEMNINATSLTIPGVSYAIHRMIPMGQPNTITMMWLNTKTPFIERIFVPWMQDNTINAVLPLVKADLKVQFPELKEFGKKKITYWYYGIRPIEIGLHKMTNEPVTDFYRKVSFDFDYFWVES